MLMVALCLVVAFPLRGSGLLTTLPVFLLLGREGEGISLSFKSITQKCH